MLCVQFYSVCEILLSVLFFTMCVKLYTQSKFIHCVLNYTLCLNLHSLCKKEHCTQVYIVCQRTHILETTHFVLAISKQFFSRSNWKILHLAKFFYTTSGWVEFTIGIWPKCIRLCLCVFACMTPHDIAIKFLVPRAFQKYSTCMVYSDFLLPGPSVFVFVFVYLHV